MATGYLVNLGTDSTLWAGDTVSTTAATITGTRIGAGSVTVSGTVDGQTVTNAELGGAFYEVISGGVRSVYFVPDATSFSLTSATVNASPIYTSAQIYPGTNGLDSQYGNGNPDLMFGLDGNDVLVGGTSSSSIADEFNAGGGRYDTDVLVGDAGNDALYGEGGWDRLKGGTGNDNLYGGNGMDIADMSDGVGGGVKVDLSSGSPAGSGTFNLTNAGLGSDKFDGIDGLIGTNFNDTLIGYDGDGYETKSGSDGSAYTNYIDGGAGNDYIDGKTGSDFLFGGDGSDTVIGGLGDGDAGLVFLTDRSASMAGNTDDHIFAGTGDDVIYGDDLAGTDGAGGNDLIDGGAGNDTVVAGAGDDTVYGGDGADSIRGDAGNDLLYGGDGSDTIIGGAGNDTIIAGAGNDSVDAGDGADSILGGTGDDTIYAGNGADTIIGAGGSDYVNLGADTLNDVFVTANGAGMDTLVGFKAPADTNGDGLADTGYDKINAAGQLSGTAPVTAVQLLATGAITEITVAGVKSTVITFPSGDKITLQGVPKTSLDTTRELVLAGIVCFTTGTMIETAHGAVAIETLLPGDLVHTRDHGLQPLRWIGTRRLSAEVVAQNPKLRPVRISAGALGVGVPSADLIVSPQHRVLVRSRIAQKLFGTDEVLVAAKQLLQLEGVDVVDGAVEYVHILFDRHEVVVANGAESESLYTGEEALRSVGPAAREEIFAIFPELRDRDPADLDPPARELVSGKQARKLTVRHIQAGRPLVS